MIGGMVHLELWINEVLRINSHFGGTNEIVRLSVVRRHLAWRLVKKIKCGGANNGILGRICCGSCIKYDN
jgi:hypothetical protein